ncbi:hypothetical protein SDC9_74828 [bioreactor metagenome]|uniref:DUF7000 domain-containing protein n=1 Tax=bioreactor metagenome TaxID=1076179 RepID=A0A644YJ38_9ZZZZ
MTNELSNYYTALLQEGKLQEAYRGIISAVAGLRTEFAKEFPDCEIGSVYQGYMDMSYFPVTSTFFKERGLKIAVVYLHEKGIFEVWLSGKNRQVTGEMRQKLAKADFGGLEVFHDEDNPDAVIECLLTAHPDFDDVKALANTVLFKTKQFITAVKRNFE